MDQQRDQTPTPAITKIISQLLESGTVAVVVTVVAGTNEVGSKLVVDETGQTTGTLGDTALDKLVINYAPQFLTARTETRMLRPDEIAPEHPASTDTLLLFERIQPSPRLIICGAGHVGASLAKLASFLGYHTTLIDDRAEFLDRDRFPEIQIELKVASSWKTAVREAMGDGKNVSVAVVTRGHNEDEECMREVVRANPDYVGLIGSKRRTSIVIERLRESGVSEEVLTKIRAPIGLDIGAVSPEEVALAIIAEIVSQRRGGKGGSLSAWRRMSDKL